MTEYGSYAWRMIYRSLAVKRRKTPRKGEMTKADIFDRLVDIAGTRASQREELLAADLVNQENLFEIQDKISGLLLDVANDLDRAPELVRRFPYAFAARTKRG